MAVIYALAPRSHATQAFMPHFHTPAVHGRDPFHLAPRSTPSVAPGNKSGNVIGKNGKHPCHFLAAFAAKRPSRAWQTRLNPGNTVKTKSKSGKNGNVHRTGQH